MNRKDIEGYECFVGRTDSQVKIVKLFSDFFFKLFNLTIKILHKNLQLSGDLGEPSKINYILSGHVRLGGGQNPAAKENVSLYREKINNARNVLKRKNMQRHFQRYFQGYLQTLVRNVFIFPSQPDIFFIAKLSVSGISRFKNIYFYHE